MSTPEIAVYSESSRVDPKDLAFWVEASNLQLREHAAPLWSQTPLACILFDKPPAGSYPMAIKDEVPAGELGDHGNYGDGPVGTVLFDDGAPVTLSHECLEMWGDPQVNLWRPYKDGSYVALELCDAVEAQTYLIPVTIFGETRNVPVSNFVTPNYFIPGSEGPWDYLQLLPGPLTIAPGGYLIILNANGNISNEWARNTSPQQMARAAAKFSAPHRRAYKRLHAGRPPMLLAENGTSRTPIQLVT